MPFRQSATLALRKTIVVSLVVGLLTASVSTLVVAGEDKNQGQQVTVWVNTNSGIYWCPGSRWYGKTKKGKYMAECDAIKAGYRPAYNRPCGSKCQ